MKLKSAPNQRNLLYDKYLKELFGISFTFREIDIIACLVHNRNYASIAELLSIPSIRTVQSHIRNIKHKLDSSNNSGNYRAYKIATQNIINRLEKSDKLKYFREYYFHIRVQLCFEKILHKIGTLVNSNGINCLKDFETIEDQKNLIIQITKHLKLANITLSKNKDRYSAHEYNFFTISVLPSSNKTNQSEQKFIHNSIILIFESGINSSITTDLNHINFSNYDDYYFNTIKLIEKIINKPEITKIFREFKYEYQKLQDSWGNAAIVKYQEEHSKLKSNSHRKYLYISFFSIVFSTLLFISINYFFFSSNSIKTYQQNQYNEKTELFNIPQQIEYYTNRQKITDAIWNKLNNDNSGNNQPILIGLYGLGGVGKTTLAKNIILNSDHHYTFKGWFSSETENLLKADYFQLGEKHNLFLENISEDQKIMRVKDWLNSRKKILLIYDNVPDMEMVKKYLPNSGDILITSRNCKLPGAIELDVMSNQEAVKLIEKIFLYSRNKNNDFKKDIKSLANTLGYLPLALSQAGGYIVENSLTISEYLSLYNTEKDKLLSDSTTPAMDTQSSVYITWDMSLEKIRQHSQGTKALSTLDFIAYCHPEKIPKKLLSQHLFQNVDNTSLVKLNKVLSLLRKYSLIKTNSDNISVHRLVHSWLKSKHSENKKLQILLNAALDIEKMCNWQKVTIEDSGTVRELLPHAEAILLQIRSSVNKDSTYVFIIKLLNRIGAIYQDFGNLSKALEYYQESIKIQNSSPGNIISENSLDILSRIGHIYTILGKLDESIDISKKILEIEKSIKNDIPINIANAIHNLGVSFYRKGKIKKSLSYFEEALKIRNQLYQNKFSDKIFLSISNLSHVYCKLGKMEKSLQYAEKSLKIIDKYYDKIPARYLAFALQNAGVVFYYKGDLKKSLHYSQKSLEARKKLLKNVDYTYVAEILNNIGVVYQKQGNFWKSLYFFEQALDTYNNLSMTEMHLGAPLLLNNIGDTYVKMGHIQKGLEYSKRSLKIYNKLLKNINHPELSHTLNSIGTAYYKLGSKKKCCTQIKKAICYLERAYKMRLDWYKNKDHQYVAESFIQLNQAYKLLEKQGKKC